MAKEDENGNNQNPVDPPRTRRPRMPIESGSQKPGKKGEISSGVDNPKSKSGKPSKENPTKNDSNVSKTSQDAGPNVAPRKPNAKAIEATRKRKEVLGKAGKQALSPQGVKLATKGALAISGAGGEGGVEGSTEELKGAEESEAKAAPKKNAAMTLLAGAVKKAAAGVFSFIFSKVGLIVLAALIIIPTAFIIYHIQDAAIKRTIDYTQKYGCVEDKFTLDFLGLVSPGNETTLADSLGDLFSEDSSSCMSAGVGWNGDFYPPTVGNVTQGWYYSSGDFHGASDISNGSSGVDGAPIFAYAGGEVISRVNGTENTAGGAQCNRALFAPWSYTKTVQGHLVIAHEPGVLETHYSHLWQQDTIAQVGDIVSAGDLIAGQGNSGWSCGTHLHFEIHENGERVETIAHMAERGIVFPYSKDTLPPKPESDPNITTGEGDGGRYSAPPSTQLMKTAVAAMQANDMPTSTKEQNCLVKLWNKESNWRHTAENPSSGAYGIPQALPGDKMSGVGADWKTNPETQIKWGMLYIKSRYGTPCEAWTFHISNNWY